MSATVTNIGFEALYREHHNWLRRLILCRLSCADTAADLMHDTFLRLLVRDQDLAAIEEPRAYLSHIANGLIANHWRRRDVEQAYLEALRQRSPIVSQSPETRQMVIDTLCQIDAMLCDLPDKVRQAFLLSRLDGVRYAQVAATLGVSERMVKKYMAQAMLHCLRVVEDAA